MEGVLKSVKDHLFPHLTQPGAGTVIAKIQPDQYLFHFSDEHIRANLLDVFDTTGAGSVQK